MLLESRSDRRFSCCCDVLSVRSVYAPTMRMSQEPHDGAAHRISFAQVEACYTTSGTDATGRESSADNAGRDMPRRRDCVRRLILLARGEWARRLGVRGGSDDSAAGCVAFRVEDCLECVGVCGWVRWGGVGC